MCRVVAASWGVDGARASWVPLLLRGKHGSPLETIEMCLNAGSALVLLHGNIPLTRFLAVSRGSGHGLSACGSAPRAKQRLEPLTWGVREAAPWGAPPVPEVDAEWVSWTPWVSALVRRTVTWAASKCASWR